jgi:uncharacterized membrane protein
MQPSYFFSKEQKEKILQVIREAERNTSGEIRVHIDKHCRGDALDRAAYVFEKLQMHRTKLRNGVLFYLAVEDRKFAILGDAGINAATPENFWDNIKSMMMASFSEGDFTGGLIHGISMAGTQLKEHFPFTKEDVNELPDDISFGENQN